MFRMLLKQLEQHAPRLVRRALQRINPGQVHVRLIEGGRHPDALFETGHRLIPPPGAQVEHAKVVQGFGITGTRLQRPLQILVGPISVVELREDHPQAVVRLRILRADCHRALQQLAGFVPILLLPVSVPQILERDQVIGIELERLLEVWNRFGCVPFPRGQQAEIVPGVGHSVGITGLKFGRALEALPRLAGFLLLQINASQPVECLGALRIVAQGQPK